MQATLAKFFILAVLVGFGLWMALTWLLDNSGRVANMDVRTLSHHRDSERSGTAGVLDQGEMASSVAGFVQAEAVSTYTQSAGSSRRNLPDQQPVPNGDASRQSQSDEQTNKSNQTDQTTEPSGESSATPVEPDSTNGVARADGVVNTGGVDDTDGVVNASGVNNASGVINAGKNNNDGESSTAENDQQPSLLKPPQDKFAARKAARYQRLAELGLIQKKAPEPTIAVDVSLLLPEQCANAAIAKVPIGLKFRFESSIIKGESLNALESLVASYRECPAGMIVVAHNPLGREDATDSLKQLRLDEIKYFFIQHRVPIDMVKFPEK